MRHAPMLVIALLCPCLQSQPPTPTPTARRETKQNEIRPKRSQTNPDNKASSHSPAPANEKGPEGTAESKQDSRSKKGEDSATRDWTTPERLPDWLLAIFTFVLVCVGILQWLTMQGHERALGAMRDSMRDGLEQTKKAADAAAKSADVADLALKLAERADILLLNAGFSYEEGLVSVLRDSSIFITFENLGRTRANHVRFDTTLVVEGIFQENFGVGPIAIGPGQSRKVVLRRLQRLFPDDVVARVLSGGVPMYFTGVLTYEDVFQYTHTLEYKGIFDPLSAGFLMEDPSQAENH